MEVLIEKVSENYWNRLALEAEEQAKTIRLEKWRKAARNWLSDYADKRAQDFVMSIVKKLLN